MKDYAIPISLVGAALIIVGGLAYLISPDTGSTGLVNAAVGLLLVVSAGFINADLFRQYGRWLNAFWGGIMVFGIVATIIAEFWSVTTSFVPRHSEVLRPQHAVFRGEDRSIRTRSPTEASPFSS